MGNTRKSIESGNMVTGCVRWDTVWAGMLQEIDWRHQRHWILVGNWNSCNNNNNNNNRYFFREN